jgi:hypothetical protein
MITLGGFHCNDKFFNWFKMGTGALVLLINTSNEIIYLADCCEMIADFQSVGLTFKGSNLLLTNPLT